MLLLLTNCLTTRVYGLSGVLTVWYTSCSDTPRHVYAGILRGSVSF